MAPVPIRKGERIFIAELITILSDALRCRCILTNDNTRESKTRQTRASRKKSVIETDEMKSKLIQILVGKQPGVIPDDRVNPVGGDLIRVFRRGATVADVRIHN
jgi:hypothetical protein